MKTHIEQDLKTMWPNLYQLPFFLFITILHVTKSHEGAYLRLKKESV